MECTRCGATHDGSRFVCTYCGHIVIQPATVQDELTAIEQLGQAATQLAHAIDSEKSFLGNADVKRSKLSTFWQNAFIPTHGEAQVRAFYLAIQAVTSGGGSDDDVMYTRAETILDAYKLGSVSDPSRMAAVPMLQEMLRKARHRKNTIWYVAGGVFAVLGLVVALVAAFSKGNKGDTPNESKEADGAVASGQASAAAPGGQGPRRRPEGPWGQLLLSVQIGDDQRFEDLRSWCESTLQEKYAALKPCNSFNTWFWCSGGEGEDCQAPGSNPLERADNEKYRSELREAFLGSPAIVKTLHAAGSGVITADDYNVSTRSFRMYLRAQRTFASVGGGTIPFVYTYKVQTIFGERKRSVGGSAYEAAPITLEVEMDENKAREFYALALPYGCASGDCPVSNLMADVVFRLEGYRKVGEDCLGQCEAKNDYVYKLLGFQIRVAETIDKKSDKPFSFKPNDVIFETIYEKPN